MHFSRRTALLALLAALPPLTGCGVMNANHRAETTVTMTAAHVDDAPLRIVISSGSIEVRLDETLTEVRIEARLLCGGSSEEQAVARLKDAAVTIVREDDATLVIRPVFPEPSRSHDAAHLTVHLPSIAKADLRASNGSIHAAGLRGPLEARSTNGAITIEQHDGPAVMRGSNGRMTARSIAGDLRVETSNGRIDAEQVRGSVHATASNGAITIDLDDQSPGPVTASTSNGAITLITGEAFRGAISAQTRNGGLTLRDPARRAGDPELGRRSGTVTLGEGGEASSLRTTNGTITVEVRE